jgi:hypothetical protein
MSAQGNWEAHLAQFPRGAGYAAGHLPIALREELRYAVTHAPVIQFSTEPRVGADIVQLDGREVEALNKDHAYRDMDDHIEWALWRIFDHLRDDVARFLKSPWRVLTCRSWTTRKGASKGPNSWHTDGDHPGILKMMLYGNETGGDCGGFEFKDWKLNGETWVLFYNSVSLHRGVAPRIDGMERVATEVTLCPSNKFDLEPKFLGLAARHAIEP